MILPVAITRNVSIFYTHDLPMTKLVTRKRLAGSLAGRTILAEISWLPGGQLNLPEV